MRIGFSLMSVCSLALLVLFSSQGEINLHSLKLSVSLSRGEAVVAVDPVFVVLTDSASCHWSKWRGLTFGNVILIPGASHGECPWIDTYVLAHELNHVEQYRALGWWHFPMRYLVNIEPDCRLNLHNPGECDRIMWLPPDGWVDQWHFITVKVDLKAG